MPETAEGDFLQAQLQLLDIPGLELLADLHIQLLNDSALETHIEHLGEQSSEFKGFEGWLELGSDSHSPQL
jgi:hypothetical protein